MQLLCVHADAFGFDARNPAPDIDTTVGQREADLASAVVVFVAVESEDPSRTATTTHEATATLEAVTEQLNTDRVGLVPCRQLTDTPADGTQVGAVIDRLAATLDQFTVARVPLGWDVAYDIETKAHPHAVQHYEITPTAGTADSEWLLYGDGVLGDLSLNSLDPELATVLDWERDQSDSADPAFTEIGSDFELFDVDPDDDAFLRPRGVLARDLLEADVAEQLTDYDAVPVERLGTRDRSVLHHYDSAADLPVRLFESTGDRQALTGTDRWLPATTVPELSALVADLSAAFAEACDQAALVHRLLTGLGLSYEPVLRVRADCSEHCERQVAALAATIGRPVLVERRPTADWQVRLDFHVVADGQPITTPTVVIDDSAIDGLTLDTEATDPVVVRSLPAGAIERTLGAILARSDPQLPVWLAPVQLRLVPIELPAHLAYCEELVDRFKGSGIRVDIDDRDRPVRERLSAADEEGVPYYAVIGDDERDTDRLGVIDRHENSEQDFSPAELQSLLTADSRERGAGPRLPRYVSEY